MWIGIDASRSGFIEKIEILALESVSFLFFTPHLVNFTNGRFPLLTSFFHIRIIVCMKIFAVVVPRTYPLRLRIRLFSGVILWIIFRSIVKVEHFVSVFPQPYPPIH